MSVLEHRIVRGALRRVIYRLSNGRVQGGPFRGMVYVPATCGSLLPPKLVGSYEREIAPWIERICARRWARVVNLGCAEGYYAVGLATRIPDCPVVAFDIDPTARVQTGRIAELNGVSERLDIRGDVTSGELEPLLGRDTFLLSDIEGAEFDLLDPTRLPGLRVSTLLVELHPRRGRADHSIEGFAARFATTHRLSQAKEVPRPVPGAWPGPGGVLRLPGIQRWVQFEGRASDTHRGAMQAWLLCEPNLTA